MANLTPTSSFDDVYQLETSDPVLGGAGGIANLPGQQLANRTQYLKDGKHIIDATAKTNPVDADLMPIMDSAASNALKKVTWANIKAGMSAALGAQVAALTGKATLADADSFAVSDSASSSASKSHTWANLKAGIITAWGALISNLTDKATPVDTDAIAIMDSESTNATKKLTWLNAKVAIKDYFDLIYGSLENMVSVDGKRVTEDIAANSGNDTQAKLKSILGNPSRSQTTDDGLFAMYSFDRLEAGNTSVRDDYGTMALPLTGTPSPVTGVAGNGMECQCTSKFGELAAVPDCLTGTGDWAISFWHDFGDANLSSDVGIFGGAYVTGSYYSKGITIARKGSNATLYAQVSSADARASVTKASYTPAAGFSHYVWMRNGTTLSLYINGTLINTATVAADFSIAWGTMKPRIGSSRFSTASIVNIANNGTQAIDEVRIYSRALTNQEIFALYHMKTVSLDPATILALLGGDVVQASSGRRFKMCAGVIQATGDGSTWEFISNSTHAPVGFNATTPIEVSGSGIRVNYSDLAATKVVSFIAVPDETFTALGYQFGATVATGYAIITCGRLPQIIQGSAVYTDSAWVVASSVTQGSLAIGSYTDGVLKLTHAATSGIGAQVSSFGGGGLPSVKTINDAYIEVEFRDYAGTLITSPSEGLGCTVLRTYPVYQRTLSTLNLTGANIWLYGLFEVA